MVLRMIIVKYPHVLSVKLSIKVYLFPSRFTSHFTVLDIAGELIDLKNKL